MTQDMAVVGKRVPRWAVYEKVTGTAKYTADLRLPGMLTGKVLTSPHAHAKIVRIDKSKAEKLPGVAAVISWEDIPHKIYNPNKLGLIMRHPELELKDTYVLTDKARYVGDMVAAVAAINAAIAEEALSLIEVEYEVLPAVFDALEAMEPGAPKVHDFAENNVAVHWKFPVAWGDAEQGFADADVVIEETFKNARNHISQMEPCAAVASFDASGRLTIWSPSQHPFLHRRKIAELFDIPVGNVRWMSPHIGGAFGKYGSYGIEPVCVALSMKTGKPVKISFSREEDMYDTETRQRFFITGKIGLKKDGTITALSDKTIVDGGAYFTHNSSTTNVSFGGFLGLYRSPAVAGEATAVYTNVPPTGGVRGYGNHEASYVLEQMMDLASTKLNMDPTELRLKNIKCAGDPASTGVPMETCSFDELIRIGKERIGWDEKKAREKGTEPRRYGIGMGIMMDVSGAHPFNLQNRNAFIKLNEDGTAHLLVHGPDIGQNLMGAMGQIAAETMGLAYADVQVISSDTDTMLFDHGQHASGGCYQTGNAVINAALEVKKQVLEHAAGTLGVKAEELDTKEGQVFVKADPGKKMSIADVAKACIYNFECEHCHISGKGSFSPVQNPPPMAAVFCEVEVDIETGQVVPLKILYVSDSGTVINPTTVEGQLQGAIAQSVGYVLTEDYTVNDQTGVLESNNFNTYKLPSVLDMPEIEVILYQDQPVPSGPYGAKGVAQGAMVAVTPAIANAIYDATGVCVKDMPITPEKILKALKK